MENSAHSFTEGSDLWRPKDDNKPEFKLDYDPEDYADCCKNRGYQKGCNEIWDKYVKPIQEENERLKQIIKSQQIDLDNEYGTENIEDEHNP